MASCENTKWFTRFARNCSPSCSYITNSNHGLNHHAITEYSFIQNGLGWRTCHHDGTRRDLIWFIWATRWKEHLIWNRWRRCTLCIISTCSFTHVLWQTQYTQSAALERQTRKCTFHNHNGLKITSVGEWVSWFVWVFVCAHAYHTALCDPGHHHKCVQIFHTVCFF